MQLISSSTTTILSNIHRLTDKKVIEHSRGGVRYLQAFNQHQMFVETDKKHILEIGRVDSQRNDIHIVKQLDVGEVTCVAASKLLYDQLAFGSSGGQIKVINSRTGQLLQTFEDPLLPRKAVFLDYNAFDDRIAAINSDGHLTVWDTYLERRVQTFNNACDNTVVRFHPTIRFHLACGTSQGTVQVFDTLTWLKVFEETCAHNDAVTEIALSKGDSNVFLSSGYDAHVNMYDLRTKTKVRAINCYGALGTMCISECAQYFAVGTEVGSVATFDIRMPRLCLWANDLHRAPVRGMFIVPSSMHEKPTKLGPPMDYPTPGEPPNPLSIFLDEFKESDMTSSSSTNLCRQDATSISSTRSDDTDSAVASVFEPYNFADGLDRRPFNEAPKNGANQVQPKATEQKHATSQAAGDSSIPPKSLPTQSTRPAQAPDTPSPSRSIQEILLDIKEMKADVSMNIQELQPLRDHVNGPSDSEENFQLPGEHSRNLTEVYTKALATVERLASIAAKLQLHSQD